MPIRVTCDECRGAFDAPDEDADGLAPCPNCGAACLVPVPGALPPLPAEAIEPNEPPRRTNPARAALVVTRRTAWNAFARACEWLRVGAVLGFVCYFVAVGAYLYAVASGPGAALWPLVALFAVFAGVAVYGAFARTLLFRAGERCGARVLFAVGAVLAWAQALLLAYAAVRVFGSVAAGRRDAELLRQAGALLTCSALFGLVAEVSALPGFVAAGAVLPCTEVRAWALRLAVAVQLTFAALVAVVTAEVLVKLSGLFPIAGLGKFGPPVLIALGLTFALQAMYTFLQYNLYDAGARAGRGGG